MLKRIALLLMVILLTSTAVTAKSLETIEIFDIKQGQIVKTAPSDSFIQNEIKSYLFGITSLYGSFRPIPDKGYMVKIPLAPPLRVENQWLNTTVDQVILIFPEDRKPYLLVFDNENKAQFFIFEGDTAKLMKRLKYKYKK